MKSGSIEVWAARLLWVQFDHDARWTRKSLEKL